MKIRLKDYRGYYNTDIDLECALELYEGKLHEILENEYYAIEQANRANQALISRLKKAGIKPVNRAES